MSKAAKVSRKTFVVDCSDPYNEDPDLIDTTVFASYLKERIKVDGARGNLGDAVKVTSDDQTVSVNAAMPFSKRQLKYLSKKFLKKEKLRDYLHVIATSPTVYQLRFFNVSKGEE
mmetsp:Transcript_9788/g.14319  ORF Transcript_9788/g.14319 Transcript_9788/m.14319 type:complete len:115 (-) Transcript_9788:107-451(-)|eukprot:CAMPEP_0195526516 /NCGR_PEP_ID=MMETSP0794_2-20130614/27631_1 /TAXON_ID=515487 /ORGANISM="Stephanopyxis turris, Strain CCMP 815" /LENGTH=114 /DNA_ID=CAMNT_0040657225 /DNA_START=57 /DNA_END=401 /DNA_ORIENTATION=+